MERDLTCKTFHTEMSLVSSLDMQFQPLVLDGSTFAGGLDQDALPAGGGNLEAVGLGMSRTALVRAAKPRTERGEGCASEP